MSNKQFEIPCSVVNVESLHEDLKLILGDVYDGFIFDGQVLRFSLSEAITNDQIKMLREQVEWHDPGVLSKAQQKEIYEIAQLDEARHDALVQDPDPKVDPAELGRLFKRVRLLELELEALKRK